MKKRSILLTCIVAVMALAMFVGCDNAPVLPSFVVSGNITQTGDFLIGQTFDPSKFSVTVTYDNGRIVAVDDTVSVVLAGGEDSKVEAGTKVEAYIGKNYASENVTATANVRAYAIKSIAVSGPESYAAVKGLAIPASDLTVTATYLDSNNAEKTMVLVPGEYTVGSVNGVDIKKLNKVDTAIETSVTVTSQVGNIGTPAVSADFSFTATYVETPEAPEYALETINAIKYNGMLLNLVYDEIPTPAAEDVAIAYTDEAGNTIYASQSEITAADLEGEVVLEFVDANGNPLAYKNLKEKDVLNLFVRMTYEGEVYIDETTNVAGTDVKIEVTPKEGFTLQSAAAIGTAEADDFFFDLVKEADSTYIERLSSSDVEVAYVDSDGKAIAANTVLEDSSRVYLSAEYMGAVGGSDALKVAEAGEKVVTSVEFALVDDFEGPAKQVYDRYHTSAVSVSSSDIKSVTINYNYGEPTVLTDNYDGYGASFTFTTDMEGTKLVADKTTGAIDLTTVDQLYVEVTYTNGATTVKSYKPVEMTDAKVTSVRLTGTPAYTYQGLPMYDSEIDWTISLMNGNGPVVENYTGVYSVYIAGKPVDKLPEFVTDKAVTDITVVVDGMEANTVSIGAGVAYVDESSIKVELNYVPLIDSLIKTGLGDYKVTFDVVGGEADDTITAAIASVKASVSNAVVLDGANSVAVTVSYFSNEGTVKTTDPITVPFNSVSYVEFENLSVNPVEGRIEGGKVLNGQIYNVSDFVINENCYTAHGDVKLEVESVVFGGVTYTSGQTITIVSTQTGTLSVNIKPFINASGAEVKGASVDLQVVASLN